MTLRDLRVWDGALLPEQVAAEMAAYGISSPPPPAPSPPPFDAALPAPLSPAEALEAARRASAGLRAATDVFGALALQGSLPGEAPLVFSTPRLHALLFRSTAASLRASNLSLPLSYASAPLAVALPPSLEVRNAYDGASIAEDAALDVALVAWGVELHGWRLGVAADAGAAAGVADASTLSNVSALVVRASSDGLAGSGSAGGGSALSLYAPLPAEPIGLSVPVGEEAWPRNSAAEGARQQQEEAALQGSLSAAMSAASGAASGADEQSDACYGAPLRTCNERGACVLGHCSCEAGYLGPNCTQHASCQQWRGGAYTADGCAVLSRGGGSMRCGCERIGSTSFAVLSTDAALPLPLEGCADSSALSFDAEAVLHVAGACLYAAPPPPLLTQHVVLLTSWPLCAAWLGLWIVFAMVCECLAAGRLASGAPDTRLAKPLVRPSSLVRRYALRLWYAHSWLWVFHPFDYTRRTSLRLNLPQVRPPSMPAEGHRLGSPCPSPNPPQVTMSPSLTTGAHHHGPRIPAQALLLSVAPLLLSWTLLEVSLGVAHDHRLATGDLSDMSASEAWIGDSPAGGALGWISLWQLSLLVAGVAALLREAVRAALLRANHHVHLAELRQAHGDDADGELRTVRTSNKSASWGTTVAHRLPPNTPVTTTEHHQRFLATTCGQLNPTGFCTDTPRRRRPPQIRLPVAAYLERRGAGEVSRGFFYSKEASRAKSRAVAKVNARAAANKVHLE